MTSLIIQDQFGILQILEAFPILQTSFLVGTFFDVSYSKTALRAYCPNVYTVHQGLERKAKDLKRSLQIRLCLSPLFRKLAFTCLHERRSFGRHKKVMFPITYSLITICSNSFYYQGSKTMKEFRSYFQLEMVFCCQNCSDLLSVIYIQSAPNNSNGTYTFMCLGRAGRFGQC